MYGICSIELSINYFSIILEMYNIKATMIMANIKYAVNVDNQDLNKIKALVEI